MIVQALTSSQTTIQRRQYNRPQPPFPQSRFSFPTLLKSSNTIRANSNSNSNSQDDDDTNNNDPVVMVPQQTNCISKSGVSYQRVLNGIDGLFPPDGLQQRTALSRKDGYWPFIYQGNEPPKEFVYGEFDINFFAHILDRAHELFVWGIENKKDDDYDKEYHRPVDWKNRVFCDLGSGTGKLVIAAAALHQWKLCRGVELLESIHQAAEENLENCRHPNHVTNNYVLPIADGPKKDYLDLSPIQLSCGSFDDPYCFFGDADCVFAFSTAMPESVLGKMSRAIGRQCKPGTIAVTTEYPLPLKGYLEPMEDDPSMPFGDYELELIGELTGECHCTGGHSTAFFHRVVHSLWQPTT